MTKNSENILQIFPKQKQKDKKLNYLENEKSF